MFTSKYVKKWGIIICGFFHWETRNGPHLHTEPCTACEVNYEVFLIFALQYREKAVPTRRHKIRWTSALILFDEWGGVFPRL